MYKNPALTVDGIVETKNGIVLIKRKNDPYKGNWALPGGFVDYGEKVETALFREMKEEISVDVKIKRLLGIWSEPQRDPRGHTVSVVYIAEYNGNIDQIKAADDAMEVNITNNPLALELAFDHAEIIGEYYKRQWRV
ncbi:MAG: NUDIX hydrolase [Candidatus Muirbacterium halophilum]|nr:NUDIX hydrolase [Candidatus Muirbacterium halophilum]MCK9476198.1 NUDIX hydrolase [Candidatus Muirbacterium halophilum]